MISIIHRSATPLADIVLEAMRLYEQLHNKPPYTYLPYREIVTMVAQLKAGLIGVDLITDDPADKPLRVQLTRSLSASLSRTVRRMEKDGTLKLRFTRGGQVEAVRLAPTQQEPEDAAELPHFVEVGLTGTLPANLLLLRRKYRTGQEMSDYLGCSRSTLHRWEAGSVTPRRMEELILRIRKELGLDTPTRKRSSSR